MHIKEGRILKGRRGTAGDLSDDCVMPRISYIYHGFLIRFFLVIFNVYSLIKYILLFL